MRLSEVYVLIICVQMQRTCNSRDFIFRNSQSTEGELNGPQSEATQQKVLK